MHDYRDSCHLLAAGPGKILFMSPRTPIYDQFREVCKSKLGALLTTSELTTLLASQFGTPSGSVLPADYCYNRRNIGSRPLEMCLFVQVAKGEYKYLGPGAPFSGFAMHSPKGSGTDLIVGEWVDGVFHPQVGTSLEADSRSQAGSKRTPAQGEEHPAEPNSQLQVLTREQIQHLYEEYCQLLDREIGLFGVSPGETRHLIGRIGEFKVALDLDGTLANRVNQEGFDVVAQGKRISVKTTTQKSGFVTVNPATAHLVDTLFVLQYVNGVLKTAYHGPMSAAMEIGREYQGKLELQLGKLKRVNAELQ